jgi:hypothetical protein
MSKQYPGGLITKTPVTPNSISAPGIWSLSDQAEAQGTNTWPFPRDPQFNYVTMLLHGDGSAGAVAMGSGAGTSSTVTAFNTDASTNNFNVTINGDARSNNFTPYQAGYYSNYFGGSGNSINYPSATQYAIGTGNFTLEFLVNFSALNAGHNRMFAIGASGTDGLEIDLNGTTLEVGIQNGYPISYTWTPTVGTWYYMAVTRSGSTVTLYINGTSVATGTSSNSISQNSLSIGGITWQSTWSINGFLSNVRLSNTVRTIATPTTPYTSDANTLFLGAQSNRFLDTSSYAATATATGTPQVSPAVPFTLPTTVATYGSGYFDGTGDYLSLANVAALQPGTSTNPFCVECWVYPTSLGADLAILGNYTVVSYPTNTNGFDIIKNSSNQVAFRWGYPNYADSGNSAAMSLNTWNHIAVCRNSSGSMSCYLNGTRWFNTSSNTSITTATASSFWVGWAGSLSGSTINPLAGYITDARLVKGSAVYDPTVSTLTVPTAPLTAVTNTSLLTTQFNGGGNNSGFKDSGPFNFPITRNGNTTQGTFTPYAADWSNYFDGTGDYLTAPDNAAFALGTGDYTYEVWIYKTTSVRVNLFAISGGQGLAIAINTSGNIEVCRAGTAIDYTFTSGVVNNVWTHIAVTRSGTSLRAFKDGALLGTQTSSNSYGQGTCYIAIDTGGTGDTFAGYMSNLRLIKGTCLYTAAFTPSITPLTAVSGTSLLTCQSNRFIDNSSNAFVITKNGDTSVQGFSPFAPLTVYNPATYGGSAYFDGSGDYLSIPSNAGFQFGSGNFTLECWAYMTGAAQQFLFAQWSSPNRSWVFLIRSSGTVLSFAYSTTGSNETSIDISITSQPGRWAHFAAVRDGNTLTLYMNGVAVGTGSMTGVTLYSATQAVEIGRNPEATTTWNFNGYMTDARVVKGTAVYTAAFTPPTAPLTAITNTSLLVSTTNPAILDNSMMNNLETVGNAQVSTTVKKFGAASMYFDGTGDYLNSPNRTNFNVGSGDFTIEAWVYTGSTSQQVIMGANRNSDGVGAWMFNLNYTGKVRFFCSYSGGTFLDYNVGSGTISDSAWHHVAVTRSGSSLRIFIDGTQTGTTNTTLGTASIDNAIADYRVGSTADGALNFNGYIDDLRVTRGFARYTATFTVPDQAFPNG